MFIGSAASSHLSTAALRHCCCSNINYSNPRLPLPPDRRFAPPGERRTPNEMRVAVQSVTPEDQAVAAAGGKRSSGGSAFVKRLAGSFQRLHGAYVSLETLHEHGHPAAGRDDRGGRPAHPVLLPPLQHPMMVMMTAQEALQPVLSVQRKDVVSRQGEGENEGAQGDGGDVTLMELPPHLQRPRSAAAAYGNGSAAYAVEDATWEPEPAIGGGPGPSAAMLARLGADATWQPLSAPHLRPQSAVQFQRRVGSGADLSRGRSQSPPLSRQQQPRAASPPRHGPYIGSQAAATAAGSSGGAYLVRNITATPQKGFTINTGGRAGSGRPGEGLRAAQQPGDAGTRWNVGRFVVLEEGQGMPQVRAF